MSDKVFYHALGLRGYDIESVRYVEGGMIIRVTRPREKLRCSQCGGSHVHVHDSRTREFRTVPVGLWRTWIECDVPRVRCQQCESIRQVSVAFAEGSRRHTRVFERLVIELSRYMTPTDVARYLNIGWDLARDIQARHLKRKFSRPKLKQLRCLAIDEIYLGKKHKYITLVLDLERGAVVFVGRGKGQESLRPFWRKLRHSRAKIEAVATDFSAAYGAAVRENVPDAAHVFDRFHVVKLLNEKLTELRRQLHREATEGLGKDVLKGIRWLLLKNPDNLDENHNEHQRLGEALALNEPLAMAYYLKEDLRQFWEQPSQAKAAVFLDGWCQRAESTGIRILQQFAKTLRGHRAGLLAWYQHPISTGPLEGTNNKIKLMQRRAYGYRDLEFFCLKILAAHEARHILAG
jgi:transposase